MQSTVTDKTIPFMPAPSSFFRDFVVPSVFTCNDSELACSRTDVALCTKLTVVLAHAFSCRMQALGNFKRLRSKGKKNTERSSMAISSQRVATNSESSSSKCTESVVVASSFS